MRKDELLKAVGIKSLSRRLRIRSRAKPGRVQKPGANQTLAQLKTDAKNLGLKGVSQMNKNDLWLFLTNTTNKKIDAIFDLQVDGRKYIIDSEAYKHLRDFIYKLSSPKTVIQRYLGEAADEYKGRGILPSKTEYVMKDLIELLVNYTRDKSSVIVHANDVIRVAKNDPDINLTLELN